MLKKRKRRTRRKERKASRQRIKRISSPQMRTKRNNKSKIRICNRPMEQVVLMAMQRRIGQTILIILISFKNCLKSLQLQSKFNSKKHKLQIQKWLHKIIFKYLATNMQRAWNLKMRSEIIRTRII